MAGFTVAAAITGTGAAIRHQLGPSVGRFQGAVVIRVMANLTIVMDFIIAKGNRDVVSGAGSTGMAVCTVGSQGDQGRVDPGMTLVVCSGVMALGAVAGGRVTILAGVMHSRQIVGPGGMAGRTGINCWVKWRSSCGSAVGQGSIPVHTVGSITDFLGGRIIGAAGMTGITIVTVNSIYHCLGAGSTAMTVGAVAGPAEVARIMAAVIRTRGLVFVAGIAGSRRTAADRQGDSCLVFRLAAVIGVTVGAGTLMLNIDIGHKIEETASAVIMATAGRTTLLSCLGSIVITGGAANPVKTGRLISYIVVCRAVMGMA